MTRSRHHVRRICGVDFSGAKDAGKKIWIASGVIESDSLRVEDCRQARELPGSGRDRGRALAALREFIAGSSDCAFGLDFPFGLPRQVVREKSWVGFVGSFAHRHSGPDEFQRACVVAALKATGKKELKRATDVESATPFSPYNLRLYRQTYFGIRDLLAPLVRGEQVCVLPMQSPLVEKPWALEICPASTLHRRGLYGTKYKERDSAPRRQILNGIEETTPLSFPSSVRSRILDDSGGDALDSVIAVCAVFEALPNLGQMDGENPDYALEGYVYV